MEIRLQSILLPESGICDIAELYYHENGNRVAFDGYFNLFYIEKRKAYTAIDGVSISLQLYGYREMVLYHDRRPIDRKRLEPTMHGAYSIELPYASYDTGVFWFELIREDGCGACSVSGFYEGRIDAQMVHPVNIGIDICTYRREAYVERNLNMLKRRLFDAQELEVSEHLWVYVVDNGRTLSRHDGVQELVCGSNGRIRVIPNKNAGGAGGFTRGMLEILDEKERLGLTHVLLMDDDAVIEPDAVVRIYGLVSTLKDEWSDMTVGGVMMREEYRNILYCAGETWADGRIVPCKNLDVSDYANASCPHLTETGHEHEWYSGWWCCCYSLETVRRDNLPAPLFLHHDDVEFSLRNRKRGVVFLNGVGVWHRGTEMIFPGPNLYYDVRNNLIETALHQEVAPKWTARRILFRIFAASVMRYKFKDTELAYRGVMDFLKGPAWLYRQDPETLNTEIRAMGYAMHPLEELKERLTAEEYASVSGQIQDFRERMDIEMTRASRGERWWRKLFSCLTLNGWVMPAKPHSVRVITSKDSPYRTFRMRKAVLYEIASEKTYLLEKDYREFARAVLLYIRAAIAIERGFDRAAASYRENIGRITNDRAWKEYLERK